jgi:antitoxin (DNA-binding transcriptional repressor) of toxin-antitoxin stability system
MPTEIIDVGEAQIHLTERLSLVSAGTEAIIAEGSKPLAWLIPIEACTILRAAGLQPRAIWTSDDFDTPLPDGFWKESP